MVWTVEGEGEGVKGVKGGGVEVKVEAVDAFVLTL